MSLINLPNKNSFLQVIAPGGYGNCDAPDVCLPMIEPSDLAFQLEFTATGDDAHYMTQFFNPGANVFYKGQYGTFQASFAGGVMTVTNTTFNVILVGATIVGAGVPTGLTITSFGTGTGGNGTYNMSASFVLGITTCATDGEDLQVLGVMGATICVDCSSPPVIHIDPMFGTPNTDLIWKCTAMVPMGASNYVLYFQPTGFTGNNTWANLPVGTCFSICFYYLTYIQTVNAGPYDTLAAAQGGVICSDTCFTKMDDDCEGYPTSLLQYANNNDAFGFFYDQLPGLIDNINFLNSIRLPMYLHSPEYAEDQMTYAKSDGSSQKLSHRIWEDYKFKTDYLNRDQHKALVAATAHDLVFIQCGYEGISLGGNPDWFYVQNETPTQFVRTEKIEVEWQQDKTISFKGGMGKGTLRLAEASSNSNSNCQ